MHSRVEHTTIRSLCLLHNLTHPFSPRIHTDSPMDVPVDHWINTITKRMEFYSENASNAFRPHYVEGIWNQRSYSENTSNVFPATLHHGNLKTEVSLWKCIKCFLSTLHYGNLKTEVSLWKCIKCFLSTLHYGNLKTEVSLWKCIKCFLSTLHYGNLKTEVSLWKCIKCFLSTLHHGNLKTQQSSVILDLYLRKTRTGKPNCFLSILKLKARISNSSCLRSVVGKLRFRDVLVWMVGLTVEISRVWNFGFGVVWTLPRLSPGNRNHALIFPYTIDHYH